MRQTISHLTAAAALHTLVACVPAGSALDNATGGSAGSDSEPTGGSAGADSSAGGTGGRDEPVSGGSPGHEGGAGSANAGTAGDVAGGGPPSGGATQAGSAGAATGGDATGGQATGGRATGGSPTGGTGLAGGAGGVETGGAPNGGANSTGGTGGPSDCGTTLAAPTNVDASDSTSEAQVSIVWTAVSCAEEYEIYRAPSANGEYLLLGTSAFTAFDDRDVEDTTVFYYRVRAHSAVQGYSPYSTPDAGSRRQGYRLVTSWGESGTGDGQFQDAHGLTVDADGNVYVIDTYNHRVQKFSSTGDFVTKWGGITLGADPGQFYYPYAIDVQGDHVYVGDDGGRMQKFTLAGAYVDEFTPVQHSNITDVDVLSTGLFVAVYDWADMNASVDGLGVAEFDSSYAPQAIWGGSGAGVGQFDRSIHLAVDPIRSLIFVADEGHDQLHYFTLGGTYVDSWGASGAAEAQFASPQGIALDDGGFLYVADSGNGRVQKLAFDANTFTVVTSWSASAATDVAVRADQVFVLGNNQVRVFERR